MTYISDINNRQVFYLDIKDDLQEFKSAEQNNWVLFIIEDNLENPLLSGFAALAIDKNVLYVCTAGKVCSEVDDLFDMTMVLRQESGKLPSWYKSDDDVLMTSWHHDFEEGFWFATTLARYGDINTDSVLVANMTSNNYLPVIEELTSRIKEGWLPSD